MMQRAEPGPGELARDFRPDVEPEILSCPGGPRKGRFYAVAETRLDGREREYLNECLDSNWISSQGPFVSRFENAFAAEAGCEFGVACSNGTVALHLALTALGIGPGDEVIVPAFTMIAVANAARYTGAAVRLVDVEPAHFNLDPALVEAAITSRTKAIVAVHTYGHPAEVRRLQELSRAHDLQLIEDAAEAHGAEFEGKRVGSFGRASTFSFYANKVVTTGEGGMVTTNDRDLAQLARRLRDHAFHPERHFWHEYVGFNYRLTNMQAAIGLAQTERFDALVASRRRLRALYDERLRPIEGLHLPSEDARCRSVFWMYAIRAEPRLGPGAHRLRVELGRRGIETRSFFVPLHLQPIYASQFRDQRFPVAEALGATGLYLPTHGGLEEGDVDWICEQVREIHKEHTT
jgi:perosamine synthetase